MRRTEFYSIGFVAIMIFTFSQQSFAQLADFYRSPGYTNTINTALSNSVMGNYTKKGSPGDSKSKSSTEVSTDEVPAYRRYPAVQFKSTGTWLSVKEAAELLDPVPADRPETEKMLSGILDKYEAAASAKGYPNDWALALVSYICLNSRVYHGNTEKPIIPFEQNIGLRDTVAEYATDNGIFNNMTDRQKQRLYEILVMFSGVAYHFYEEALQEKNPENIKAWKLFAAQNLKDIGIKP
ncbi:MAG: DUF6683 family protein [Nitrospirota bacterium]|mgnify:CR=1 FL=1